MSSRNAYLTPEQRTAALSLSRGLSVVEAAFKAGERDSATLVAAARAAIEAEPLARIDYVELRDATELADVVRIERSAVLAVAAFVGTTRLIDNRVLSA